MFKYKSLGCYYKAYIEKYFVSKAFCTDNSCVFVSLSLFFKIASFMFYTDIHINTNTNTNITDKYQYQYKYN